jgi:hypothetical protein
MVVKTTTKTTAAAASLDILPLSELEKLLTWRMISSDFYSRKSRKFVQSRETAFFDESVNNMFSLCGDQPNIPPPPKRYYIFSLKNYRPIPWRDSISSLLWHVAGGDDTTTYIDHTAAPGSQ